MMGKAMLISFLAVALATSGLGTYVATGELFRLGADAWDVGLGGAGLALASGPGAVFSCPAGLAWGEGLVISSTLGSSFDGLPASGMAAKLAWLGLGAVRLSATDEGGNPFLQEGAAVGLGVPLGEALALGGRLRLLHPVLPEEHMGWSLDFAVQWRGSISAGLVVEAVVAQAPVPGEDWPLSASVGLALPLPLGEEIHGQLALAATGIGEESPAMRLGGELWVGTLGMALGLSPEALTVGVSAGWRDFRLNVALELSPGLSTAFLATLIVRLG